jgi:hypothetical protein
MATSRRVKTMIETRGSTLVGTTNFDIRPLLVVADEPCRSLANDAWQERLLGRDMLWSIPEPYRMEWQ